MYIQAENLRFYKDPCITNGKDFVIRCEGEEIFCYRPLNSKKMYGPENTPWLRLGKYLGNTEVINSFSDKMAMVKMKKYQCKIIGCIPIEYIGYSKGLNQDFIDWTSKSTIGFIREIKASVFLGMYDRANSKTKKKIRDSLRGLYKLDMIKTYTDTQLRLTGSVVKMF